jgi:hypothetical protein
MNDNEFSQHLLQSEPDSPEAAALANDMIEEARYPARLAVRRYLASADAGDRRKAKNVLADLRGLSLVPLAETDPIPDLGNELWALRILSDELVEFRLRAVSVLRDLLSSRRSIPPSPEGDPYQTPPGARVCDLAFLLLHRMLHVESTPAVFFDLPTIERDIRINDFQSSRVFRATFEAKS